MKNIGLLVIAFITISSISVAQVDPAVLKKEIKDINKQEAT